MEKIRIGVIGLGRGMSFVQQAEGTGMELVAVCDKWEEKLKKSFPPEVALYTDYDEFLNHGMDAVVLANYFHEHAPFAIKALKAGKHVLSETSCNATMAEGVELCRTVEKTGLIYMLAENYPYILPIQEMRRVYNTGELGRVTYADGEYNHPCSEQTVNELSPGIYHWRNWLPPTYYCTHALAPLMYVTGAMPVSVNALSIPALEAYENTARLSDTGSVILCRMDNEAVFRVFGLAMPGHTNWYRFLGLRGGMEMTRGPGYFGPQQVRVWHEEFLASEDELTERVYSPKWPEDGEEAEKAGHGGGDYFVNKYFADAIRTGAQPYFNVYRGVAASSVGILAWKSALNGGGAYAVPDFSDEGSRKIYEGDHASPFPDYANGKAPGQLPSGIHGDVPRSPEGIGKARSVWRGMGVE